MGEKAFDTIGPFGFEDSPAGDRLVTEVATHGVIDQANVASTLRGEHGMVMAFDGTGLELYARDIEGVDRDEIYFRMDLWLDPALGGLDADAFYIVALIANAAFTEFVVFYFGTDGVGAPTVFFAFDTIISGFDVTGFALGLWKRIELHWKSAVGGLLEGRTDGVAWEFDGAGDNDAHADAGDNLVLGSLAGNTLFPSVGEVYVYENAGIDSGGWIGEYAIPQNRRRM